MISHNAPTIYQGISFDGIRLEFAKCKVVKAEAAGGKTRALNKILDTDAGARYVGEFALGLHPGIREPMRDILFDEKMPTTETARRSTGTWSISSAPIGAAVKSGSTENWSAKMASSSLSRWRN